MAKSKPPKAPSTTHVASPDNRAIVLSMKGTVEFRDWLNALADSERMTAVQLMERAVVDYAKRIGYLTPAPRRTGDR